MVNFPWRRSSIGNVIGNVFCPGRIASASSSSGLVEIKFQNKFVIARRTGGNLGGDGTSVAGCVPDIISILDADTVHPVATKEIRFGF